ncbi:hypothetical protein QOZ80_6BG0486780 [Eleusine coracana subsp. coracana]|nr:hypothetical protein QOZ80_6BG0486780 [Eleusine coracana subsp. coracana]
MGRPSLEALAMAGVEWAEEVHAGGGVAVDSDDEGAPPEHLRAFEAFLEVVVPADMVLAFGRERARRGDQQRSREEDVKEKLKLWAKAVARKTMKQSRRSSNNASCVCVRCT